MAAGIYLNARLVSPRIPEKDEVRDIIGRHHLDLPKEESATANSLAMRIEATVLKSE